MKKTLILLTIVIIMLTVSSCQKDSDIFIPITTIGADSVWVSSISDTSLVSVLKRTLANPVTVDSLDATAGGTIQTKDGLTIIVYPQSLVLSSGQIATGKIYVQSMLINQRGNMVLMDRPTTSNGRLLSSGAEIFLSLMQGSNPLMLASGKTVYIKYSDSSPTSLMKIFHGDESNTERFNWLQSSDAIGISTQQTAGYEISSSSLRWIGTHYFADSSGSRINVTASLPADYTNANTAVYLVFKDTKSVVGMYGDPSSKKFSSLKVPIGKSAVVVSITKKGNNSYYFAYQNITTGSTNYNGTQVVVLQPQPLGLSDIKSYLASL